VQSVLRRGAAIVTECFASLAARTGRHYGLGDYVGAPDAERVIVLMGSGAGATAECVDALVARGERVGLVVLRLFRPFPAAALLAAIPPGARAIAVLDRTKEPGALASRSTRTCLTAFAESERRDAAHRGGRYGLGSKEFTPAMAKGVFDALGAAAPPNHFTVGIVDDVTHTSLPWPRDFSTRARACARSSSAWAAMEPSAPPRARCRSSPARRALRQGYFVYDSKKSGAVTISHVRFGPQPIAPPIRSSGRSSCRCIASTCSGGST